MDLKWYIGDTKDGHRGIHCNDETNAMILAEQLAAAHGIEVKRGSSGNFFVGPHFEIMSSQYFLGDATKSFGHFCLTSSNLERAIKLYEKNGFFFIENTIKRNTDGKITFIRFLNTEEYAGAEYPVHLSKRN